MRTRPFRRGVYAWLAFSTVFAAIAVALISRHFHFGTALDTAAYAYPSAAPTGCTRSARDAEADRGPRIVVRAPANYEPAVAHPLLVVFSPAGFAAPLSERHLGLTHAATSAGLIVAYVDSRPLSVAAVAEFARVPARVARDWCIDRSRITLAGHSDGGTVAQAVALLHGTGDFSPAAVVASGAGLRTEDFSAFECPQRLAVQIWHGGSDRHFPGYGASAAAAWAGCLGCSATAHRVDGCTTYTDCRGSLRYCEHDGGHLRWPPGATAALVAQAVSARRE